VRIAQVDRRRRALQPARLARPDRARRNELIDPAERADEAVLLERVGLPARRVAVALAEQVLVGSGMGRAGEQESGEEKLQAALSRRIGRTLSAETISAISFWMKRAVIGVPS
jgi:hypothetical protein